MSEVVWNGSDALREHLVPIEELEEHPKNLDKNTVPELMNSLRRWGQVRPVLTNTDGLLVAGHHLRKAALNLGWTHIAAIGNGFEDADSLLDYLIADNTIQENAEYQDGEAHIQMQLSVTDRTGTGVTEDVIDDTRAKYGAIYVEVDRDWLGTGEAEEVTAARAAALAAYEPHREVPLSLSVEEFEDFRKYVRVIQSEREFTRMAEAVLYALEVTSIELSKGVTPADVPVRSVEPQEAPAATEGVTSPGEHRVKIALGEFVVEDEDAAYTCKLECSCGWQRYAVHGEEAERMKAEHLGAVLV